MIAGAVGRSLERTGKLLIVLLLVASVCGCAARKAAIAPVFFPPPPDEPHVQYLTGVTTSADLAGKESSFAKLIVGGTESVTRLSKAYGAVYKNGKLYVCDIGASQIVVIDFVNKTMKNLNEEIGAGELKKPVSVAVSDDGYIYVADTGRNDIAEYAPDGKYVRSLGKDLNHIKLVAVAVYKNFLLSMDNHKGLIFVMDRKTGELLNTIGNNKDTTKNLALPNGLTVDVKGNIHVVNMGNGTVKEYDLDGNMLSEFGRLGDYPGEFTRPRGLTVDDDGNIFVVDAGHQVAQVFNAQHRILGFFGQPGLPAGSMNLPASIAVTRDGLDYFQKFAAPGFKLHELIFVTNQYVSTINSAVAVYGMGEMEKKPQSKEDAARSKDATAKEGKAQQRSAKSEKN